MKSAKRQVSLNKRSPDSKADFSEKLVLGIQGIILVRYNIISDNQHIRMLNIGYIHIYIYIFT